MVGPFRRLTKPSILSVTTAELRLLISAFQFPFGNRSIWTASSTKWNYPQSFLTNRRPTSRPLRSSSGSLRRPWIRSISSFRGVELSNSMLTPLRRESSGSWWAPVYENQRFWLGVGWKPSFGFVPPFSDVETGVEVDACHDDEVLDTIDQYDEQNSLESGPKPRQDSALTWAPEATGQTDAQGWIYGFTFDSLEREREGGRASKRDSDFVRRRRWILWDNQDGVFSPHVEHATPSLSDLDVCVRVKVKKGEEEDDETNTGSAINHDAGYAMNTLKRLLDTAKEKYPRSALDPIRLVRLGKVHEALYARFLSKIHAESFPNHSVNVRDRSLLIPDDVLDPDQWCNAAMACIYARAAYGYPMKSGSMDTIASFLDLNLRKRHLLDCGGISDAVNTQAVIDLAGLREDTSDLVYAYWSGGDNVFSPSYFFAEDHAMKWCVLSIRGTLSPGDVLTDVTAEPCEMKNPETGSPTGNYCHEGVLRAAELILRESKTRLEEWSRLKGDDYQLVLAGHSMGAAVATLVGILLRERRGTSKFLSTPLCFAFACPPVVSRNLAIACEPWVLSFVYDLDCVPRMSVTSLMNLIGEFHPVNDDSDSSTKESILLYPGGRIIHITSDSPARKGLMPPEDCTKILVSPRMIESHLIGNYMEKLCELAHSASSQHRDVPFSTAHSFQALKDMIQRVGINEASGSPT